MFNDPSNQGFYLFSQEATLQLQESPWKEILQAWLVLAQLTKWDGKWG